jgi:hypothetical protein
MLQKLETFMTQSPDVRGVTIDFGDAPAHGRWRAMSMTITLLSPKTGQTRAIKWRRFWYPGFGHGDYDGSGFFSRPREPYERVTRIRLNTWELVE